MSTWQQLADLTLEVDGYTLEPHEQVNPSAFRRLTTVISLAGGGARGRGEDVSYTARDQEALRAAGPVQPLTGRWTLAGFSGLLDELELWPEPPAHAAHRDYRRWAYESAALDLALAQAGTSLAGLLGREPRPVRFVAGGESRGEITVEPTGGENMAVHIVDVPQAAHASGYDEIVVSPRKFRHRSSLGHLRLLGPREAR